LERLKALIETLIQFGINPKVNSRKTDEAEKTRTLQRLLVEIYSIYLSIKPKFDETKYEKEPDFNYEEIRLNVSENFPNLGYYAVVLNPNKVDEESEIGIADSADDLSDIIKDMLAVRWRTQNTSLKDAVYHFEFSMRTHSEKHLLDLLGHLKSIAY
jgi:hypothetical protein